MTSPATTPHASPAVLELDGISIRPLDAANAGVVVSLLGMRGHNLIVDLPRDPAAIAQMFGALAGQPWTLPLAAVRDNECIGVCTSALADVKAMHTSFTTMFVEPAEATLALAMCVRHLFWSFPVRRFHAQIPDTDLTREYVGLLESVGFVDEGRLRQHAIVGSQPFDVVSLGLLRADFEQWCEREEPRLALEA